MIDVHVELFFDDALVISATTTAEREGLSKIGAYTRTRAQRSIRKRKKSSTPGDPPSSHDGRLRQLIWFNYEPENHGVVVGPKLFGGSRRSGSTTVPELLEYGGTANHWRTGKPSTWHAFPYMHPAMNAEMPRFAKVFENTVK